MVLNKVIQHHQLMKKISQILLIMLIAASLSWPLTGLAADDNGLFKGLNEGCLKCGNCDLCDIIQVSINFADLLVGLSGVAAILMFVLGGTLLIIDFGSDKNIQKGKEVIKAAIFGLVIILGAWTIVNLTIATFVGTTSGSAFSNITSGITGGTDGAWNVCASNATVKDCPSGTNSTPVTSPGGGTEPGTPPPGDNPGGV